MLPLKWKNLNMISSLHSEAVRFIKELISFMADWKYSEYKRRRRRATCYTNLWKF